VQFAVEGDRQLHGSDQQYWLDQLEAEHDNLRASLAWANLQGDGSEPELELSSSLALFWYLRDYMPEGRQRLEKALSRPSPSRAARMRALAAAGWLAHFQRDQITARTWIEESLTLARELGDQQAEAWALHLLGRTYYFENDAAMARTLAEQSLATARAVGDLWLEAWAIHLLGIAAYLAGDYAAARAHEEEGVRLRRGIGDEANAIVHRFWIGLAAHREGDYASAITHYVETLNGSRRLGFRFWQLSTFFSAIAALAAAFAEPERAVPLAAALSRHSERFGMLPIPPVQTLVEEGLEQARATLSDEAYAAAWSRGLAIQEDEIFEEALAIAQFVSERVAPEPRKEPAPSPAPASERRPPWSESPSPRPRSAPPPGLTARELEILRLAASGLSSSQIAEELVLSVRTVERHLSNIYDKLGVHTRAQATAYAHIHGLMAGD
jgi:non-specific serine/threonine protein kinase